MAIRKMMLRELTKHFRSQAYSPTQQGLYTLSRTAGAVCNVRHTDLRVADPEPIGSEPFWSDPESDLDPTQKMS